MQFSRVFGLIAGVFLLCGCSLNVGDSLGLGSAPSLPPTTGVGVGDEPFAVQAGVSLLSQGGSAADAAAAIYFALTVTYPVSAGLGGGGLCIVQDPGSGHVEEFDFLARDASGSGAYAVPGAVKGFADLQAAYGLLPWQRDVAPAEGLAGGGFPISQALDQRLVESQDVIRLDAALRKEFLDESGQIKKAGTIIINPDIAATLAAIRTLGPKGFYSGPIGAEILAYSSAQGGAISPADLVAYTVARHPARGMILAGETVYLPTTQTGSGAFVGALFENLAAAQGTDDQAAIADATRRALGRFRITDLPKDMGSTGFAAIDSRGQAVACAVTMNGPFGSGHSVTGSGIMLARSPSSGLYGLASAFLTPVMASDKPDGAVTLVGAGAGGPNGTAAIIYALSRGARSAALLGSADVRTTGAAPYETVNVVDCREGACVPLNDPGANGMGAAADATLTPPQ